MKVEIKIELEHDKEEVLEEGEVERLVHLLKFLETFETSEGYTQFFDVYFREKERI